MGKYFSKNYYPLFPLKPGYKLPRVLYLSSITQGDNIRLCLIDDFQNHYFTPKELTNYLDSLDNNHWIITYYSDFIPGLFPDLLKKFLVSSYGDLNLVYLENNRGRKHTLISLFYFFVKPLATIYSDIGLNTGYTKPILESNKEIDDYLFYNAWAFQIIYESFQNVFIELFDTTPAKSPGATSVKSWRRTLKKPIYPKGKQIQAFCFDSIHPPALHWKTGIYPDAYQYDINASYPAAMKGPYPTRVTAFYGSPKRDYFIARVNIDYTCDKQFSPLPVRLSSGKIIHPAKTKNLETILTHIDILTLSAHGVLTINKFIEGIEWGENDQEPIFRDFINTIEKYILEHPEYKNLLKVTTRALHSKFAQKADFTLYELRAVKPDFIAKNDNIRDIYPIDDETIAALIMTKPEPIFKPYIMPEYETLTLAMGRYMVYSGMDDNTIYIDTDGIISSRPRPDLPINDKFGAWKLQKTGPAFVIGPRQYSIGGIVKLSGIRLVDNYQLAREAVKDIAIDGKTQELTATEYPNIKSMANTINRRLHTLSMQNYPYSEITGSQATVINSPESKHSIYKYPRRLTADSNILQYLRDKVKP